MLKFKLSILKISLAYLALAIFNLGAAQFFNPYRSTYPVDYGLSVAFASIHLIAALIGFFLTFAHQQLNTNLLKLLKAVSFALSTPILIPVMFAVILLIFFTLYFLIRLITG